MSANARRLIKPRLCRGA